MRLSRMVIALSLAMTAAFAAGGVANAADGPATAFAQAGVWEIQNCDGRYEHFEVRSDRAVWHRWQTSPGGSWSNWASLGGIALYGSLGVGRNWDCKLEIFVTGTNHQVYTRWHTQPNHGPWANWTSIGGYLISAPYAHFNEQDHLGVCATGGDWNTWCNYHTKPHASAWTGWHRA